MKILIDHCYPLYRKLLMSSDFSWAKMLKFLPQGTLVHVLGAEWADVDNSAVHTSMRKPGEQVELVPESETVESANITYHFIRHDKVSRESWLAKFNEIEPDVYYSNSYPEFVATFIEEVRAKSIIRLHGNPDSMLKRVKEGVKICDVLIVPWPFQVNAAEERRVAASVRAVTFGIDTDIYRDTDSEERNIDFLACASSPLKNFLCINDVFNILNARGFKTKFLLRFSQAEMVTYMNRGVVLFHPSVTEGASRLISEAASCGVIPVVDVDVTSTRVHASLLYGHAVKVDSTVNDDYEVLSYSTPAIEIADRLTAIRHYPENDYLRVLRQQAVQTNFNITTEAAMLARLVMETLA